MMGIMVPRNMLSKQYIFAIRNHLLHLVGILFPRRKMYLLINKRQVNGNVHSNTGFEGPEGGVEVQIHCFFKLGVRRGLVVSATYRPLYPRGMSRDPLHTKLSRPQDKCGQVRKILSNKYSIPRPSSRSSAHPYPAL